ncbi:MAG: hypothetical protein HZA50_19650 [Planctomycetes bacterium]|nr:hypothetical protein [Planctomycetota bacterium]
MGIIATVWAQGAAAADPAKAFEELFGPEARAAAASKNTRDAADFARKLMDGLQQVSDNPALREYVLNKAIELAMKDPDGFEIALQAVQTLIGECPSKRGTYKDKLLEIFQARYEKAGEYEKFDAGEDYIRRLLARGDELMRPRPAAKRPATQTQGDAQATSQTASQPTATEVSEAAINAAIRHFKTAQAVAEAIKSDLAFEITQRIDAANEMLENRK